MRSHGSSGRPAAGDVRRRWSAPFRARNYRAVVRSLRTYVHPLDGLGRYVLERGGYPCDLDLRTPLGVVTVHLPHPHDVRTLNEVFCRRDYGSAHPRSVLDVGANIGIAALFFLTRRPDAVVHCYEPHPQNLPVLRANVEPFADRVLIHPVAVAETTGTADFVADPVGRYSGLAEDTPLRAGRQIQVPTRAIDEAVERVCRQLGSVDLVKIDTEGSERRLVDAMSPRTRDLVGEVLWEDAGVVRRERWAG